MSSLIEEQSYISNLISINKNLRDQLELLYKLISKKIIIDTGNNNIYLNKLIQLINELETLKSNLSIQMKTQNDIMTSFLTQSERNRNKYEQIIQEHNETIQSLQSQIEEISNDNIIANNKVVIIEKENTKLINQLIESKASQKKIIESNSQLAKENEKLKEEKLQLTSEISSNELMIEEMNIKIDELSSAMKEMEEKYKKKIQQKNMIIATIDKQLQEYEHKQLKDNDEDKEINDDE